MYDGEWSMDMTGDIEYDEYVDLRALVGVHGTTAAARAIYSGRLNELLGMTH